MTPWRIREATEGDLSDLLKLNNAAVPAVNELSPATLGELHSMAAALLVAEMNPLGENLRSAMRSPAASQSDSVGNPPLAGFLLLLHGPGENYQSINYRWFCDRYDAFLYVDRVVVREGLRDQGLGTQLYQAGFALGRAQFPVVCAEVNLRPRNEGSLRFHDRHGFAAVGEQDTEQGSKRVRLLAKSLKGPACPADTRAGESGG